MKPSSVCNLFPRGRTAAAVLAVLLALAITAPAQAWWNKDFKERTKVTLNTSAQGVETKSAVPSLVVPVRLHSGNFDFLSAKPDGSDLRVMAGDDKTPLAFHVERFDGTNELGVLWVQVPSVLPGTDKNTLYVYAGSDAATAQPDPGASLYDSSTLAVFHFGEKDGIAADVSGGIKATGAVATDPNGLIGGSAKLSGKPISWPATDKLRAASGAPYTVSLWVRPDNATGTVFQQGTLKLTLAGGKYAVTLGSVHVDAGTVAAASWSQLVVVVGEGKLAAYVNGAQAGQAALPPAAAAIVGPIQVGEGFAGLVDELTIAAAVRAEDFVRVGYAAQSADAKLVASKGESSDSADSDSGGGGGYFGILIKNLTPDAWVVIALLGVMFVIAAFVMVSKAVFVTRVGRANHAFLARFRDATDPMALDTGGGSVGAASARPVQALRHSSLMRLYEAGVQQLRKRRVGEVDSRPLSGPSMDAVRAAIDADMVRENYRLNARMVLLTIAIAGGPFLGLLGTVVGVMITFAAIAAAGDVNVNAIAPGIAAALLATVAGLGVAIPSLFGYNYLASRIKVISSDMAIFVDEFVTRVAELYGER